MNFLPSKIDSTKTFFDFTLKEIVDKNRFIKEYLFEVQVKSNNNIC